MTLNRRMKSTPLAATACLACALVASGCRLFVYDADPYGPPPPAEPVYYIPAPTIDAPPPGTYIYSPEPYPDLYYAAPQPGLDVNVDIRGQAPADDFPTVDEFPTVGEFPTLDGYEAPPESSELTGVANNATVPDPSGEYVPLDPKESFSLEPKRQSISEREAEEKERQKKYNEWRKSRKKPNADSKTPRYLQPIQDDKEEIFAREETLDEDDKSFMRTITVDELAAMQDDEQYNRDLYYWEEETPTPVDWSKYALSIDTIRAWFGMGPNEKAALEYMRQACLKQKEYEKTREPSCLKEAALLYEKAADRWPGPALRPDLTKKNPFQAPKSGTLIEEDGLFFAGECWFFYKDFSRALSCYRALVQTYNASIYKDTATKRLFFIGNYWMKLSEESVSTTARITDKDKTLTLFSHAQKAYEAIFLNDVSDAGLAPEALFALANGYMRRGVKQGDGSFENAAFYYRQIYENYPGHKRAEDASRLAMIAYHRSYLGPHYDDQPLEEARRLAEAIIKSGRGNLDVAYEELQNIKDEQAKRLLILGDYYERRGSYASARSCYNRLVKEFPNSGYATDAAVAYNAIETKPAEVDQLKWVRPIAPFLPKMTNEFYEERPDARLSEIAKRESRLNKLGEEDVSTELATSERNDKVVETATRTDRNPVH